MSMTKDSAEYFKQVADQWDSIRAGYFTEAVREAAIAKAYLRPEMLVADVGAGTGYMTAGLAPLVQKVFVLDGSPAMLDQARRTCSSSKISSIIWPTLNPCPCRMDQWMPPLPTCTCTTAPTRWLPSGKWCASSNQVDDWSSRIWIHILIPGSKKKWPMCGWASSANRCAPGFQRPGLSIQSSIVAARVAALKATVLIRRTHWVN